MATYVIRRALQSIPLAIGVSILIFAVLHLLPGGPLARYAREGHIAPEQVEELKHELGLDRPLPVQYVIWLKEWIRGDWGLSYSSRQPVRELLAEKWANSLLLLSLSFSLSVVVGVGTGIVAAIKRYSLLDAVLTTFSFAGFCVPVYWLGLILIYIFNVRLGWFPSGGMYTLGAPFSLADRIRHLILPVSAASLQGAGIYSRYLRSSLLEVMNLDYVRTARAKGLHEKAILLGHILRNALIPLVTVVSMDVPWILGGAVLTETIFSWPGMSRQFWQSATERDYPVVMAWVMVVALAVVFFNLLADVLYAVLDPRVGYGASGKT